MGTNAGLSTSGGLLKTAWTQTKILEMVCDEDPLLGMLPKDTSVDNMYWKTTVGTGYGQGLSVAYASARANRSPSTQEEFSLTPKAYYGSGIIDGRLVRRADSSAALVINAVKRESRNVLAQAKKDYSKLLWGNGGGARGQVLSVNSNTITLTSGADLKNFAKNMVCVVSTADGTSGAIRSGSATVTAIGTYESPTVTFGTIVSGTAAGDYVFREGAFGGCITGIAAWLPTHSGSPADLLGVVRSTSPEALAGVSLDGTSFTSVKGALFHLAVRMRDTTGPERNKQTAFISTALWESFANEVTSVGTGGARNVKAPAAKVNGVSLGIEYDAIEMTTPLGTMKVVPSAYMAVGEARILTLDKMCLKSSGALFQWINDAKIEGGKLKMENDADAYEFRLVSDGELDVGEAPGHHGVIYNLDALAAAA